MLYDMAIIKYIFHHLNIIERGGGDSFTSLLNKYLACVCVILIELVKMFRKYHLFLCLTPLCIKACDGHFSSSTPTNFPHRLPPFIYSFSILTSYYLI